MEYSDMTTSVMEFLFANLLLVLGIVGCGIVMAAIIGVFFLCSIMGTLIYLVILPKFSPPKFAYDDGQRLEDMRL